MDSLGLYFALSHHKSETLYINWEDGQHHRRWGAKCRLRTFRRAWGHGGRLGITVDAEGS